jgi:ATP-dependent protease ClpP protease subunit
MAHRLTLIGEIGASDWLTDRVSAHDFQLAMAQLPDDGAMLDVVAMSLGGDFYHSAAIRQSIEDETSRRPVTIKVYGVAASGAAHVVVGARGARVEMARDAILKIHGSWDVRAAGAAEHRYAAESSEMVDRMLAEAVAHRAPSVDADELARTLSGRSPAIWYDVPAAEAVEIGLADGFIESSNPELAAMTAEETDATASQPEEDA